MRKYLMSAKMLLAKPAATAGAGDESCGPLPASRAAKAIEGIRPEANPARSHTAAAAINYP